MMELKCFVKGADANKLKDFPSQVKRLESAVQHRAVSQGIVFCTFIGYQEKRVAELIASFFDPSWQVTHQRPILDGTSLKFIVASYCPPNP